MASDYIAAGAILYLKQNAFDGNRRHASFTVGQLTQMLNSNVSQGFTETRTEKVLRVLDRLGVGEFVSDPFAESVYSVFTEDLSTFLQRRQQSNDVFDRSSLFGISWLQTAYAKDELWIEFDQEPLELIAHLSPPEKQQWTIDQDSNGAKQAIRLVDELSDALKTGNNLGDLSAEDVERLKTEVSRIGDELRGDAVQLPDFGARVRSVFGWIAKKAAETVVGELAQKAFKAVMDLITIPF